MNDALEAAPVRTAGRHNLGRLVPLLGVAAIVVAVDQLTKSIIRARLAEGETWEPFGELLRISHVENSGAAFGILQGAGAFLAITAIIGTAAIVAYLFFAPIASRWFGVALSLVLGGAVGNLVDRLARGTVTDFIDPTHYPSFNIADSCIVVGVCVLLYLTYTEGSDPPSHAPTHEDARR